MITEIVVGIIIVGIVIAFFSKLKRRNNDINDYYPFESNGKLK